MQRNIGLLDRYVRILSGLLLFGCASGMKRSSPLARGALLTVGAMKIAEGITGWCPVMEMTSSGMSKAAAARGDGSRSGRPHVPGGLDSPATLSMSARDSEAAPDRQSRYLHRDADDSDGRDLLARAGAQGGRKHEEEPEWPARGHAHNRGDEPERGRKADWRSGDERDDEETSPALHGSARRRNAKREATERESATLMQ